MSSIKGPDQHLEYVTKIYTYVHSLAHSHTPADKACEGAEAVSETPSRRPCLGGHGCRGRIVA